MADRVIALIHYYSREGYARQIQGVCNEVLKKRAGDPVLIFWRAYGLQLEGSSAEVRALQRPTCSHAVVYSESCEKLRQIADYRINL